MQTGVEKAGRQALSAKTGIRVLFVVPHPIEGPSSRFRVYQFLPYLEAHGVQATVRPLISSALAPIVYAPGRLTAKFAITAAAAGRRLLDVAGAGRFDLAYVLREAFPFGPPCIEWALKRRVGRLIFDFDDAIYLPSLAYQNPLDRLRDFSKTATIIRSADHVVAGSRFLRDYAVRFAPSDRVSVLPTVVDTDVFRPEPVSKAGSTLTIGWIGTPRGSSYLRDLRGVMATLAARHPQVRFVFIGAEPFEPEGLPISFRPWQLGTEVEDIRGFDIGIMPLTDDEETRGKCGFKLIEYMSLGIPTVSSPVGANLDIVEDNRSGFFASTPDQWIGALNALVEDAGLRRRFASAGLSRVEESYSLASVAPRLLALIRTVVGADGSSAG